MNTDNSAPSNRFVVVLDRPQDSVNIGAVLRAVKNMGFVQVRLVNPRPFAPFEIQRVAHHAEDVIAAMRTFPTLDAALADAVFVVGTSAVLHPDRPLRRDIEVLSRELAARSQGGTVALLFGTEDDGLDTAALDRCHCLVTLPTNPAYPALNLAQSVLLLLYELAKHTGTTAITAATPADGAPAAFGRSDRTSPAAAAVSQATLERLFTLGEEALAAIGFFRYNPQAAMRMLRQLAYRAELQPQEAALFMAIARQMLYVARRQGEEHAATGSQPPAPHDKTAGVV
jgi:TrmH family RNA methyltransferase